MSSDYEKLVSILKERGISMRSFAKLTNISASTISSAAIAKRSMPWDRATTFAAVLGIQPQEICETYPRLKRISNSKLPPSLRQGYIARMTATADSSSEDVLARQQYLTGPLSKLFTLATPADMEGIDTLLRTYLSLSSEGRKELVDLAQVTCQHHASPERVNRLKGIKKWASLQKRDTH